MCKHGTDTLVKLAYPKEFSKRKEVPVDSCIAPLVQLMNDYGINTTNSCCGHGEYNGSIHIKNLETGTEFQIMLPKIKEILYNIWVEGDCSTGQSSKAKIMRGDIKAESFKAACDKAFKGDDNYSPETLTYWGCKLFDNEDQARKLFG